MNKLFWVVLCFYNWSSGFGQTESWNLQKCMNAALQNSIDVKISRLHIQKAQKERLPLAQQWLPTVGFTGSQNYNFGSTIDPATNARVSSNIQNDNFFLNAQTNLLNFRELLLAQQTQLQEERAKAELAVLENEYQLQILESYFQALFVQELVQIQSEQLKNAQSNLSRIAKEVQLGSKPKSDWYDMQFSVAQEEIRLLETQQDEMLKKQQLFQLINVEQVDSRQIFLETVWNPIQPIANPDTNNPRVKAAQRNLDAQRKEVQLRKVENWPELTAFYGFSTFYYRPLNQSLAGIDNFATQIHNNKNHQLGIQLHIPIFNGFRASKSIAAAKIEAEKGKLRVEQEIQKIQNQLAIEASVLLHLEQLGQKLAEIQQVALASFTTTQAKFTSGLVDAVVFNTVKNQWLSTVYDSLKNKLQQDFTALKIKLIQGENF